MKTNAELKKSWLENYSQVSQSLRNIKKVKAVATAFNANVDAVIKIKPAKLMKLIEMEDLSLEELRDIEKNKLSSPMDVIKGIFKCFELGIAEEWLAEDVKVYDWMVANIGYDRLQVGGQGGIVSNALGVAGVEKVYVHCNSLPKLQADQFVKKSNVVSFDSDGKEKPAYKIDRITDIPLIHWIIEFNKGDSIELEGHKVVCPKSNRFIATYDPLNHNLAMDKNFVQKMSKKKLDFIVLSGFHALTSDMNGVYLIEEAVPVVESWKKAGTILHLEIASTQDVKVRKAIVENIAAVSDSIGMNERETIDVLEVIGENELAKQTDEYTHSVNLFKGLIKIKQRVKCPRVQLHMFGLYLTIQDKGFKITPEASRRGMCAAAVAAASKAGQGDINTAKKLHWAEGKEVSNIGLKELEDLAAFIGDEKMNETGVAEFEGFDIIAVPTILVEKPITLVGMGDTISSMSLVSTL